MPRSMTGFGAAEGAVRGGQLRVEVRTVNHRYLTPQLKVPDQFTRFEPEMRDLLRRHFDRGHVTLAVRWAEGPELPGGVQVNLERAREVVAALRELKAALALPGEIEVSLVARQADVLSMRDAGAAELDWGEIEPIVQAALGEALRMRAREGAVLCHELEQRFARLTELMGDIGRRAPARLVRERDRLQGQVAGLTAGARLDEQRLAQEIALLADRIDITEELVRLQAHVAAAREALGRDTAVGKELGFLGQEMLRETNTIGAKANDAEIAGAVIAIKGELEKIREQLENLE